MEGGAYGWNTNLDLSLFLFMVNASQPLLHCVRHHWVSVLLHLQRERDTRMSLCVETKREAVEALHECVPDNHLSEFRAEITDEDMSLFLAGQPVPACGAQSVA